MPSAGSASFVLTHLAGTAHLAAGGHGFILWVLFRLLARGIGWVGAIAVIVAFALIPAAVRRWQQR
jgi:hypothetical protein